MFNDNSVLKKDLSICSFAFYGTDSTMKVTINRIGDQNVYKG